MKKFILCLLIIVILPIQTMAESSATADANLDFNYVTEGTYYSTESPNLIQAGKTDGSNITTPNAYWNNGKGDAGLPNLYRDLGFHIADIGTNTIDIDVMKKMASFYFFNSAISTGVSPLEKSDMAINILNHFPKGKNIKEVSCAYGRSKKHDELPMRKLYTLLEQAWEEGKKPKNVLILYKVTPITKGDILALGLAGVNSTAHAGSSEPGKSVTSGAFGTGIGTAQSWVWNGCYYLVIFFNQSDNIATTSNTVTKKPLKVSELIKTKNVSFAFDSYNIDSKEQQEIINRNAEIIAQKLQKLGPNQKIYIVGGTSDEGSDKYNLILGENRAYAVATAYISLLSNDFTAEFLSDKIRYVSIGEIKPDYEKKEENRRTFLLVAEKF